jgi:hypothetical protein
LGAREIPRSSFVAQLAHSIGKPALVWRFEPQLWHQLIKNTENKA